MASSGRCNWVNSIPIQNQYFSLFNIYSHTPDGENLRFLRQVWTRLMSNHVAKIHLYMDITFHHTYLIIPSEARYVQSGARPRCGLILDQLNLQVCLVLCLVEACVVFRGLLSRRCILSATFSLLKLIGLLIFPDQGLNCLLSTISRFFLLLSVTNLTKNVL